MRKIITAAAIAGAFVAGGLTTATASDKDGGTRRDHIEWTAQRLRPCPQEDSNNCHWNAKRRGDGRGRSFIDLNGTAYRYGPFHGRR